MSTEDEIAALKAATREAHEAIQDLRAVIKESKAAKEALLEDVVHAWGDGLDEVIRIGLENYAETIKKAIDDATKAVFDRFDTLADQLLGEGKYRGPSLAEIYRRARDTT